MVTQTHRKTYWWVSRMFDRSIFLDHWRYVRSETAREVSPAEYRILDHAMHGEDPITMAAGIDAVGNPRSVRLIRHELERFLPDFRTATTKRISDKKNGWWRRITNRARVADRGFLQEVWVAVEPYVATQLPPSDLESLKNAFHSGSQDKVLKTLRNIPQTTATSIIRDELKRN